MTTTSPNTTSITNFISDDSLIEMMESVRELCSIASSIRTKNNIRNRQPLNEMKIIDYDGKWTWLVAMPEMVRIIKDECNVKKIIIRSQELEVGL